MSNKDYCAWTALESRPWVKIFLKLSDEKEVWVFYFKVFPLFNDWTKKDSRAQFGNVEFGVEKNIGENSECATYKGPLTSRSAVTAFCNAYTKGYVYMQSKNPNNTYLTVCEFQVYGRCKIMT